VVDTLAQHFGFTGQTNLIYNLNKPTTLAQLENVGIQIVVVTTLEDIDENHIDGATIVRDYEKVNGRATGWWVQDISRTVGGEYPIIHLTSQGAANTTWSRTSVSASAIKTKEQSIRVTLRCRVFDVKKRELLESRNKTYARGRSYAAAAAGNNELSMGDMYQRAAEDLSYWEKIMVEDMIFPIKVIKVEDNQVVINRGVDSGLRKYEHYNIINIDQSIKDPDTGNVLGKEERIVGEVVLYELGSQFSKANIINNSNIQVGSILSLKRN